MHGPFSHALGRVCGVFGRTYLWEPRDDSRFFFWRFLSKLLVISVPSVSGVLTRMASLWVKRPSWLNDERKRTVATLERKCSGNHRRCHMKSCVEPVPARSIERYPLRLVNAVLRGR